MATEAVLALVYLAVAYVANYPLLRNLWWIELKYTPEEVARYKEGYRDDKDFLLTLWCFSFMSFPMLILIFAKPVIAYHTKDLREQWGNSFSAAFSRLARRMF